MESSITAFVEEWVAQYGTLVGTADVLQNIEDIPLAEWMQFILTDDDRLCRCIPKTSFINSAITPTPIVINIHEGLENVDSRILEILGPADVYCLFRQRPVETVVDFFARAAKSAQKISRKTNICEKSKKRIMKYITAVRSEGGLSVQIFTADKLVQHLGKLICALEYEVIIRQEEPICTSLTSDEPKRGIWLLYSPGDTEAASDFSFQLALRPDLPWYNPIPGNIMHFYSESKISNRFRSRLDTFLKVMRQSQKWQEGGIYRPNILEEDHFVFLMEKAADNEVSAGKITQFIESKRPSLVVFHLPFSPTFESPFGKIIAHYLAKGIMIWWCCHDSNKQPSLSPERTYLIARSKGKAGERIFNIQWDDKLLPRSFRIQEALPMVSKGKYQNRLPMIRKASMEGQSESDIAQSLGLKIDTIRQIKRQAQIRVNSKPATPRRNGMDRKISNLRKKGISENEIAKKLKTSPSYIRRRFRALDEKAALTAEITQLQKQGLQPAEIYSKVRKSERAVKLIIATLPRATKSRK